MSEKIRKSKKAQEQIALRESMDNSVFVDNAFMKHVSNLTLTEAKIVRYLIMRISNVDEELKEVEIDVKTFADLIGVSPQNLYAGAKKKPSDMKKDKGNDIKDICDSLYSKKIYIENPNNPDDWFVFGWLAYAGHEKGKLKFKLNEKLKDYLLYLKKHFTAYKLEEIVAFRSVYSIRIYELIFWALSENKMKKPKDNEQRKVYLPLDLLKKYLGVEEKYSKISHFKSRILDPAMEDINERSEEYHVTYTNDKSGHSVIGFTFTIETKIGYDERIRLEKQNRQLSMDDYVKDGYIRILPG